MKVFNAENIPEQASVLLGIGGLRRTPSFRPLEVLANTDALIGADYFNFESMKNKSVAATRTGAD